MHPGSNPCRSLIRLAVLLWFAVTLIDAIPWGLGWADRIKQPVSLALNWTGLWQGQWGMFAPGPSVNNWWLTAEIQTGDQVEQWESPFWMEVPALERFRRFRYLNYYNRIQLPQYRIAAFDFARFLKSNKMLDAYTAVPRDVPADRVMLYSNGLEMVLPDDGSFPPPDEIVWVSFSHLIAEAE